MKTLLASLILLLLAARSFAETEADFAAANRLFQQGKFAEAVSGYDKIISTGAGGAAVYFNLGNASLKAGLLGRAVAAYRVAEKISPRDGDLRANLRFARSQVADTNSVRPGFLARTFARLTLNEWTLLASLAVTALFILLALGQWQKNLQAKLRHAVLISGLASAFLLLGLAADWLLVQSAPTAVVIARETVVRNGPLDEAQSAFTAHDGVELAVLDHKDDWFQVSDAQQRIGWVKCDAVQVL